jgi:hypothetical protein
LPNNRLELTANLLLTEYQQIKPAGAYGEVRGSWTMKVFIITAIVLVFSLSAAHAQQWEEVVQR